MRKVDITSKTVTLLTSLSVVYAFLEGEIVFLSPIITIAIPYIFMKSKDIKDYGENKKTLNNLFVFNIITFIVVCAISNNMNEILLDTIVNIFVSFVYLRIIWSIEGKQDNLKKDPEVMYTKLKEQIEVLEKMKVQLEHKRENAKSEKTKLSIDTKLQVLEEKISQDKNNLDLIKLKIEAKER